MEKNHTIILSAEKAFPKIQQVYQIKVLNKLEIKGNRINLILKIYENDTGNIILNDELLNDFFPDQE